MISTKKNILILGLLVISITISMVQDKPDFDISGKWTWADTIEDRTFDLELTQENEQIRGDYCAIAYSGNFIDCWLKEEYKEQPLTGEYIDGLFKVKFDIAYTGGIGYAIIDYNKLEDKLIWIIDSANEVTYCPDTAILVRD